MFLTLLFAIISAALIFAVINFGVDRYIETEYLSKENREERSEWYRTDLQSYVTENGLDSDDTRQIAKWAQGNRYLYVLIYKDDELLFESGDYSEDDDTGKDQPEDSGTGGEQTPPDGGDGEEDPGGAGQGGEAPPDGTEAPDGGNETGGDGNENSEDKGDSGYTSPGITVKPPTRDELIANAIASGSYPIYTVDGGVLLASMVDYTEYLYYDIGNIAAVITGVIVFIAIMWIYFYGIAKRITKLSREVTVVANGNMEHEVVVGGDDEIAKLSLDVDHMRSSMVETLNKERAALDANKELITAMSHDIRTPLTVLLGYLDIMKQSGPDESMREYISASEATALRLKKMSDDMFGYFLVYGGSIEVDLMEYEAGTLLDQMLSGHVFLLREQGYNIRYKLETEPVGDIASPRLYTDPAQLMRIIENIFSNLLKYADKEREITVDAYPGGDKLTVRFTNYISSVIDPAQKNGIGLKSCNKIASALGVGFRSETVGEMFLSELSIPTVRDIEETADEAPKKSFIKRVLSSLSSTLYASFETVIGFFKRIWKKLTKGRGRDE